MCRTGQDLLTAFVSATTNALAMQFNRRATEYERNDAARKRAFAENQLEVHARSCSSCAKNPSVQKALGLKKEK
jgi:hypothetical protein